MKWMVWVLLAGALSGCGDARTDLFDVTDPAFGPELREATSLLMESRFFAVHGVGISGEVPEEVVAFQVVLRSDLAGLLFAQISADASLAGQMYGLAGLYLVERNLFLERARRYAEVSELVSAPEGCVDKQYPASELVRLIEEGEIPRELERTGR